MADVAFEVKDAGGAALCNQMNVDGMRINTFNKPPSVTAAIIRNIKNLKIRDDDVMLCTAPKSATHWGFEITSMLLQGKAETTPIQKVALMLVNCSEESMESIPSPRVLNTHFPYYMLPEQMKEKKTKVVLILRNPKDTVVSFYHHHKGMKMINYDGKFEDYLPLFMEGNLEYNSWFDYVLGFEKAIESGDIPIHLTFFEDLKENGLEEIKKIAAFLNVQTDDQLCQAIHEKCNFKKMVNEKSHSPEIAKIVFKDGFSIFRKGEIGDWKNYFTVAQSEAFDKLYEEKMKNSKLKFRFEPSGVTETGYVVSVDAECRCVKFQRYNFNQVTQTTMTIRRMFAELNHLDDERKKEVQNNLEIWWTDFIFRGQIGEMTESEFVAACNKDFTTDRKKFHSQVEKYTAMLSDVVDVNKNKLISEEEYHIILKAYGHANDFLDTKFFEAFGAVDGLVPMRRMIDEWVDFITSEDSSKENIVKTNLEGGV